MARKRKSVPQMGELQPDELGAVKTEVREFVQRIQNIDNEIAGLRESRKDLIDEFSERLDVSTLQTALKVLNIESTVKHKHNYDVFTEVLKDDFVNGVTDEQ